MASPLRPASRPPVEGGPLRILDINVTYPDAYVPVLDRLLVTCVLSRPLTKWEKRAAIDDPMLTFDPSVQHVGTLGEFTDQLLEVTVTAVSDFDADTYREALNRLEAEGQLREQKAQAVVQAGDHELSVLRKRLGLRAT